MRTKIVDFLTGDEGASAVEYSLLAVLIAAAIAGTVALIGPKLIPGFQTVMDALP